MKDENFLIKLKEMLEQVNQPVTDIEMTSGNYDTIGHKIKEQVPTITTDLCEIGRYQEKVTYFTVILYSDSFSKRLFDKIKDYKDMHIYGFKNFLDDLYPKEGFSYREFEKELNKDKYVQIQFNFDSKQMTLENIFDKYLVLLDIFNTNNAQVIDQINYNFQNKK